MQFKNVAHSLLFAAMPIWHPRTQTTKENGMHPLRVFMRGWLYNLRRSARNNLHTLMGGFIRQRVPGFDRRRKA